MNDSEIFPDMTLQQYLAYLHADAHQQKVGLDNKINDLMSLVKTANDALMILPLIKGLTDTRNNTSDIQGRLVNTAAKIICASSESARNDGGFYISAKEAEDLRAMAEDTVKNGGYFNETTGQFVGPGAGSKNGKK